MPMLEQCPLYPAQEPAHAANRRNTPLDFHDDSNMARDRLYQEFAPLVRRLIRQYGTTPDLHQDLVGEIYCCFCHVLEAFDPERGVPLHPYIVRQLTGAVYVYVRQQWQMRKREVLLDPQEVRDDPQLIDPTPVWIQTLSDQEICAALPKAIMQLPERQRQVVIWRYYEERSFEEIADVLTIRPSTARSLLRHGLNRLRTCMQPSHCGEA